MLKECLKVESALFEVVTVMKLSKPPEMMMEIHKGKDPTISLKWDKDDESKTYDKETKTNSYKYTNFIDIWFPGDMERQMFIGKVLDELYAEEEEESEEEDAGDEDDDDEEGANDAEEPDEVAQLAVIYD